MDFAVLMQAVGGGLATVALVGAGVAGLVLWLAGSRIARAACVLSGLVLGGLGGFVLGELLAEHGGMVLVAVVAGAMIGALLAGLLFRLWVALSGAALLALAAPAAVLIWQGAPPVERDTEAEPVAHVEADAANEADAGASPAAELDADEHMPDVTDAVRRSLMGRGEERAEMDEVVDAATEAVRQWYDRQAERVSAWWSQTGSGTRGTVYILAALGAVAGLGLGLLAPLLAASLESALAGAVLLLLVVRQLAVMHAPTAGAWMPDSPRAVLVTVGLITLVGFLLQWTFFARRADR